MNGRGQSSSFSGASQALAVGRLESEVVQCKFVCLENYQPPLSGNRYYLEIWPADSKGKQSATLRNSVPPILFLQANSRIPAVVTETRFSCGSVTISAWICAPKDEASSSKLDNDSPQSKVSQGTSFQQLKSPAAANRESSIGSLQQYGTISNIG